MTRKPPDLERRLVLVNDQRRKYGVRLFFEVQRPEYIGRLDQASLLLEDGTIATIRPASKPSTQAGSWYEISTIGFPKASEAEDAGTRIAQALLLTAISLNLGLRLRYESYEPSSVYDRTISPGMTMYGEGYSCWPEEVFLDEFFSARALPTADHRMLLSMELYAASALESNDRVRFVMAVSALEPLAAQAQLGETACAAIDKAAAVLAAETNLESVLHSSLMQRLTSLKRESIRQALRRICNELLPGDIDAWKTVDSAYALRSQLLHDGQPADLDVLLSVENVAVSRVLRRIYADATGAKLKVPAFT